MAGIATTDYNTYIIHLEDTRATFQVISHTGVLLASQVMEIGATGAGAGSLTQARLFSVTHIPAIMRVLNTGAAGTAPQIIVNGVTVQMIDGWSQRDHAIQQSGMGLNSLTSPTAYTQLANWTNSVAPTTRTLSNTAAAETTLGGMLRANSIAGGNTDLITQAFMATRAGGTTIAVGVPRSDASVSIPTFPLVLQEKKLIGCVYGSAQVRRDFPRFLPRHG